MTIQNATGLFILIATIWIGWPLHQIAANLTALRKMAERGRERR